MSHDNTDAGHGNSPAAWTSVVIMLVAFTVGTIAFFFSIAPIVWASAGLLVVGFVTGIVLARLGYGVGGARIVPRDSRAAQKVTGTMQNENSSAQNETSSAQRDN